MAPKAVKAIVEALEPYEFKTTHGAFDGLDVGGTDVKLRIVESAKIAVGAMGYSVVKIFGEEVDDEQNKLMKELALGTEQRMQEYIKKIEQEAREEGA